MPSREQHGAPAAVPDHRAASLSAGVTAGAGAADSSGGDARRARAATPADAGDVGFPQVSCTASASFRSGGAGAGCSGHCRLAVLRAGLCRAGARAAGLSGLGCSGRQMPWFVVDGDNPRRRGPVIEPGSPSSWTSTRPRGLAAAERLLIITGAGLSADSGLPIVDWAGYTTGDGRRRADRGGAFGADAAAPTGVVLEIPRRDRPRLPARRAQRRPFRHCRVAAAEARHLAAHAEYRRLPSPGRQSARAPDRDSRRAGTAVLHGLRRG